MPLAISGCDDPVASAPVATLALLQIHPFLDEGATVELTAMARDASGEEIPHVQLRWDSRDSSVAVVSNGKVTGVSRGVTTILANAGDVSDSVMITVEYPADAIHGAPATLPMVAGRSKQLEVQSPGNYGHSRRYFSSDPLIATVSESGMVHALAPGTAIIAIIAGSAAARVPVTVIATSPYEVIPLGTLGGAESLARDINESGQVVGRAQVADGSWHAFLWEDGAMRDLGALGHSYNEAVAINDSGLVAGTAGGRLGQDCQGDVCGDTEPWIWKSGVLTRLSLPFANSAARVTDLNNRGQVIGYTYWGYYRFARGVGLLWEDGQPRQLQTVGDVRRAVPFAINDSGTVVGEVHLYVDGFGVEWREGPAVWAGRSPPARGSSARAINAAGVVFGSDFELGLYRWEAGTLTVVGPHVRPADVTSDESLVGSTYGDDYGFLLREGEFTDLNTLMPADAEWTIKRASAINERGQIVGYGTHLSTGASMALLLNPRE